MSASLLACSPASDAGEPPAGESVEATLVSAPKTPDDEPSVDVDPAVLEIDVGTTAANGDTVPIAPVAPTPMTVTWREIESFDEIVEFVPLTSGILARSPSGYRELDDGAKLALRPELEVPDGPLLGYWPVSVWHVEVTPLEPDDGEPRFEYRMSTLKRGRWVAKRRRGAERWKDGALQFRKGWHGGLLLRNDANITRIGSKEPKPRPGARSGKNIVDMFETRSGRVYTISSRETGLYVQANCRDFACVEANAKKLPRGQSWSFSMQVPRRRHDASMLATLALDERVAQYLLHYDDEGWLLEPLAQAPTGIWPDDVGGLWIVIDGKLWHRDAEGSWRDVELPGAGAGLSAAMLGDRSELWVAVSAEGKTQVFATAGTPAP